MREIRSDEVSRVPDFRPVERVALMVFDEALPTRQRGGRAFDAPSIAERSIAFALFPDLVFRFKLEDNLADSIEIFSERKKER
jgi:hypothetical protein